MELILDANREISTLFIQRSFDLDADPSRQLMIDDFTRSYDVLDFERIVYSDIVEM